MCDVDLRVGSRFLGSIKRPPTRFTERGLYRRIAMQQLLPFLFGLVARHIVDADAAAAVRHGTP
jgi:hypothetical protein